MDLLLFYLLNAVLFLRPAELIEALLGLPIYQVVLLCTVAAAWPHMIRKLQLEELKANPIHLCVLGMLIAVPLSHLRHFDLWSARHSFMTFGKTALYYLLFVSIIRDERRLDQFFKVLLLLLGIMTSLSLLHHHGYIYLPQLDSLEQRGFDPETGLAITYDRLQSTGIFNDPNDFAMILVIGLVLSAYFTLNGKLVTKPFWLAFLAAMAYALVLTKSRGGFLALFAAAGVFAYTRWGWKRAALVGLLMLPIVAAAFAMRGDGGIESGTGQSRIQLWSQGFSLMKNAPVFGIGYGMYAEEVGYVAHNSFVHCYVELGLIGGTFFFGCFYFAAVALLDHRRNPVIADDYVANQHTTLVLAILLATAAALLSLSRSYGVPTFMILGIATVHCRLNESLLPVSPVRFNSALAQRLALASCAFIIASYLFTRFMVRWG